MVPWVFLAASIVGVAFTANAFWPISDHRRLFIPSFLFSWLTMELARKRDPASATGLFAPACERTQLIGTLVDEIVELATKERGTTNAAAVRLAKARIEAAQMF